jgi:hypothetical protein
MPIPGDGAEGVAKESSLLVRFSDNSGVVASSVFVYVRGELVYSGATGEFSTGYKASTIVANAENGYDVTVTPDRTKYWREQTAIPVRGIASDAGDSADETFYFTPAVSPLALGRLGETQGKMYPMILRSVRRRDEG